MIKMPSYIIEELKNMSLEDFKEITKTDKMSIKEMEELKQKVENNINIRNDIYDLIVKYGSDSIVEMLKILLENLQTSFDLIPKFRNPKINDYNYYCKGSDKE